MASQDAPAMSCSRRLAILFLMAQGLGGAVWWIVLLIWPESRAPFLAPGAPDSTLLAFVAADGLLYVGCSLVAAVGLARRSTWSWPLLCVVAGATLYAGLYGLMLPLVSGGGGWAALLMLPSTLLAPLFAWLLRPGRGH